MTESRKLEEAAATLDDVALALEEVGDSDAADSGPLDKAREALAEATDAIEDTLLQHPRTPEAS